MPYVKRIVCLANSIKTGGSCIAGKEVIRNGYGGWIRPISDRPTAEISAQECSYGNSGANPVLLDVIDVPLLRAEPKNHQCENHMIDPARSWTRVGSVHKYVLPHLRDRPQSLWTNGTHTRSGGLNNCIEAGRAAQLHGSLLLIHPRNFHIQVERAATWGSFYYNGEPYRLKVTDPVAIAAYRAKGEGDYSVEASLISVSLTEEYVDGRCHKLIAAVFTA